MTTVDRPVDVCVDGRRVWTFWTHRDTVPVGFPVRRGPWPLRHAPWPQPLRTAPGRPRPDHRARLGHRRRVLRPRPGARRRRGPDPGPEQARRSTSASTSRAGWCRPSPVGPTATSVRSSTRRSRCSRRCAPPASSRSSPTARCSARSARAPCSATTPTPTSATSAGTRTRSTWPASPSRSSGSWPEHGWQISRYSGASFKIYVTEADVTRGLDVFGGFLDAGRLHLMGEIGTEFERDWIYPLGTAELDGRPVPVPARPEKLLEAMYGPGWQVPDPAFKFTTPDRTIRAFDDWFRGIQPGIRHWDRKRPLHGRHGAQGTVRPGQEGRDRRAPARRRGPRRRRGQRVRQPVAGPPGPPGDGVRLRHARAGAGPGAGGGGVPRRSTSATSTSPTGGRCCPRAPGWPAGHDRGWSWPGTSSTPRPASAASRWPGCARWRCATAGGCSRSSTARRRSDQVPDWVVGQAGRRGVRYAAARRRRLPRRGAGP